MLLQVKTMAENQKAGEEPEFSFEELPARVKDMVAALPRRTPAMPKE